MKNLKQITNSSISNFKIGLAGLVAGLMIATTGCEKDNDDSISAETNTTESVNYDDSQDSNAGNNSGSSAQENPVYSATGIVPQDGDYSFSQRGSFSVGSSGTTISFSEDNSAHYGAMIQNGRFCIINGDLLDGSAESTTGNLYPTDGFGMWGQFTSETTAEGSIYYSYAGRITEGPVSFSASK